MRIHSTWLHACWRKPDLPEGTHGVSMQTPYRKTWSGSKLEPWNPETSCCQAAAPYVNIKDSKPSAAVYSAVCYTDLSCNYSRLIRGGYICAHVRMAGVKFLALFKYLCLLELLTHTTKPCHFRFAMQMMCIETHTIHERDCNKTENMLSILSLIL